MVRNKFIVIGDNEIPVKSVFEYRDADWGDRKAVLIRCTLSESEARELFTDEMEWSYKITYEVRSTDEPIEPMITDMSQYSVLGSIESESGGYTAIKLGVTTDLERLIEIVYGGVNNE